MSAFVVDTNVALTANGRATHVGDRCCRTCIDKLDQVVKNGLIVMDRDDAIFSEYADNLSWSGSPGVGDVFFKHVFNNKHRPDKVRLVSLTPTDDDERGFVELPPNAVDRSDRKFLAAALVARVPVLNATDSDWREHRDLITDLGGEIHELCPNDLKGARV